MSIAEIERFAADLQSNEDLRGEAEKAQADKSHDTPLARAVAFGASKGYAFTADEAKAHATAKAKADGKVPTDAELDGVAGGIFWFALPFLIKGIGAAVAAVAVASAREDTIDKVTEAVDASR